MDYQKNIKENIVFKIKLLVPIEVLISIVLYYITQPLYLRAYILSYNQQQVQQCVPKRYNNIIYKLFFRSKTIKLILNGIIRIKLIIYIEDPKEAFSVDHVYREEDTKIKKTTIADIITTTYPVGSNTISIINLDTN